jgi:D-alanine-D-alanine ligase
MSEPLTRGEEEKHPGRRMKRHWKIAVVANIKDHNTTIRSDSSPEIAAEYDRLETINDIRHVLEEDGHKTVFIPADNNFLKIITREKFDICFNLAEGLGGEARESQVPAMLEFLRIPYTGSRVLANAISLNKTLAKRIWRDNKLPVAPFQEFNKGDEQLQPDLVFPLFVKPSREGAGAGIGLSSIVQNENELRRYAGWIISSFKQPALVESFLPGREFTVGILGNPENDRYPDWYINNGYHFFPITEVETSKSVTPGVYSKTLKEKNVGEIGGAETLCPATIDAELEKQIYSLALQAHNAISALDVSRTDIRLNINGEPTLMEINTLPGLTKNYSDLCLQAQAEGTSYADLILEILYLGASRWGMLKPREPSSKAGRKQ